MGMTREDLSKFIKDTTIPQIKAVVDARVAEIVREQVERSLKAQTATAPSYVARMFEDREPLVKAPMGTKMARCIRAIAAAKHMGAGPEKALDILRSWGSKDLAEEWAGLREKALGTGDPTQGGFLVPTEVAAEMIELLRPAAVVRSLGPTVMQMTGGKLEINRLTTGATAAYVGENQNISKTEERFGILRLTFRKLACLVPISNDLIRQSSPSADTVVRDDTVRALAQREDKAFIRDNGVDSVPKGLRYWIHSDNVYAANATVNLDNVTSDLGKALQYIMAADIPLIIQQNQTPTTTGAVIDVRPGWIFSPRTYKYLSTVRHTNGPYAFRDEMLRGTLWGFPFRVTSQVLETMTAADADTGGTQTEVYFGCFAHAVIGEALGLMVDASTEAAYYDGSTVQAAFSRDQTVIRVMTEHDFALRHDKAFVRIKSVTWQ
jgi:HK97 family phage major capsid protein